MVIKVVIYPAIDVKDGKCVRLSQGSFDKVTVYGDNLVEMALKWEKAGARYIHMVDLDGARKGCLVNLEAIAEVAASVKIPVQLGGGIRNLQAVEAALDRGIARVILGTSAVKDREFVKNALKAYGEKIVIGIDAKDGWAAIDGWEKTSEFRAVDFALEMEELGARTIIYTDISRDGMLQGPNLKAMKEMAGAVGMEVIASGGVGSLKDIEDLKDIGMPGVIVGKALYTGVVELENALKIAEND